MTLQIVCVQFAGQGQIELHGRLSALEVSEFQCACAAQARPLRIDLTNLCGASAEGLLALREERARGARLTGASPYIELLLDTEPVRPARESSAERPRADGRRKEP